MVEMGVSAMQEKEGRLQGIKKEVTEMIKARVHNLQAQVSLLPCANIGQHVLMG